MPLPYEVDDIYLQADLDELDRRTTPRTGTVSGPDSYSNNWNTYSVVTAVTVWADFGVWKLPDGTVLTQGLVTKAPSGAATWIGGELMMTLPLAYRPAKQLLIPVAVSNHTGSATGMGRISVYPNGQILLDFGASANNVGWLSFTGLSWKAAS